MTPQYQTNTNLRVVTPQYQTNTNFGNAVQPASAGVSTASLVDTHGANVQVVQGGQFKDYGMITNFMGQIETVSAIEAPSFVQQVLQTQGKFLIDNYCNVPNVYRFSFFNLQFCFLIIWSN